MLRKKSNVTILMLVLLILSLVVAGCGNGGNGSSGGDGGSSDNAGSESTGGQKVELVMNHFMPAVHPMHVNVLEPFAADVFEKTEGRVEIFIHAGNALAAPGETYDAMEQGIIDMAFTLPAYTPGRFPLSTILEFPFMFSSSLQGNLTARELWPFLQEHDYKGSKLLWFGGSDLGHLLLSGSVETVDDMAGLRLRSPGPVYNDVIEALGAVPVTTPVSDLYDSIDRGIVDGTFMAPSGLISFRLSEVVTDVVELDLYITPFIMAMNQAKWDSISPQDQAAIEELLQEFPEIVGNQYDYEIEHAMDHAHEVGINVSTFSDAELAKFHEIVDPLVEKWIAAMEAAGLPGQEAYDLAVQKASEYEQ
ncbi:TRAP transporter substrate-binding protein [Anoxynatronum sibiricum]|uniref:TRAP transporter substrate-binding protein n=1 Tax=Anoxynatronum sibiricum TaxID=210623 RepID=A0ABU9VXS6_9CLOT